MLPFGCISPYKIPPNGNIVNMGGGYLFFQRLEDLRIDANLTQSQVAQILNCQREVYRRYEKGIRELPFSYAIILAKYYSVSLDYIAGLTNKKNSSDI